MNSCDFVGTLGRVWEVETNSEGKQRAKNSLAIRKYNGETLWINIIIFNEKRIPTLTQYTTKGDKLGVETHLDINDYEKDGQKKQYVSFIIDNFTLIGSKPQGQPAQQGNFQQQAPQQPQQNHGGFNQGGQQQGGFQQPEQQNFQSPPIDGIPF